MINWEPLYSVGVKEIDEQHKRFFALLNRLYEVIDKNEVKVNIDEIFKELSFYTTFHFGTEEKYFYQFNYERLEEHKLEHNKFRKKIADFQSKIKNGEIYQNRKP